MSLARRLADALTRNRARTRADHPDPRLRGREYGLPADVVWREARALAEHLPRWRVVAEDAAAGEIHAEERTRLFRFTDDIRITVAGGRDGRTRVDVHSASRVGRADLGTNARRIARFLQTLDGRLDPGGASRR